MIDLLFHVHHALKFCLYSHVVDTTTEILENFLVQTSLKFMLSLKNGNCVYLIDHSAIS